MATTSQEFGTVLGPDANFKGEFSFDSAAKVLGRIEGSIKSQGLVHVAEGSNCKATMNAKEIAIEGVVEGNVEASGRVEIKPTGRIVGDITAAKLTVAEGASIDGYCRIGANGKATSSSSAGRSTAHVETKPDKDTATAKSK